MHCNIFIRRKANNMNNKEQSSFREKFAEDILSAVEKYKDRMPEGYEALLQRRIGSVTDILLFFIEFFAEEEKAVAKIKEQRYYTNDYENEIREFAKDVVLVLNSYHKRLLGYDEYKRLLRQRHIAYGFFYHIIRGTRGFKRQPDNACRKILYMGLVDFYRDFYGNFSDNEEAIELLCKYYPEDMDIGEYSQQVVAALHMHISSAGAPGDTGYAFRGIGLIEKYIENLPADIVMELLRQYAPFEIINRDVYRHQIFAIIDNSAIEQKHLMKFWYLDSILLAEGIRSLLLENPDRRQAIEPYYYSHEDRLTGDKIIVFEKPFTYWSNESPGERTLFFEDRPVIRIMLQENGDTVQCIYRERTEVGFPYTYEDWQLDAYHSRETGDRLRSLISEKDSIHTYKQMTFSLVYLNHYRGMGSQIIDLDHEFQYDSEHKVLCQNNTCADCRMHFYGKAVESFTCIVGKNGTGKTSVVDFLRESFFKLLRLVSDLGMLCEDGYVEKDAYLGYDIVDPDVEFLVVFHLGETPFFLTNIRIDNQAEVCPFGREIYIGWSEFSKVAYFSNMLSNHQESVLFQDEEDEGESRLGKILGQFKQIDYSEMESFVRRRRAMENIQRNADVSDRINKEFCYQFAFMRNHDSKNICEYLDISEDKKFKISSRIEGRKEDEFTLMDFRCDPSKIKKLEEKYINLPDAQIRYFSSGQYAKFSFLAKLYWFLEGCQKEIERYRKITDVNIFSSEDALLKDETALIFIDEGELYYHPEWQRRYVKTMLEMIDRRMDRVKVQIIVTTNSPFLLSDVRRDDVTYLVKDSGKKGKEDFGYTLGQNIHALLKKNFFMEYTIGEYARELIENIMLCLTGKKDIKELTGRYFDQVEDDYTACRILIEQIGEPVYRHNLEKLLNESELIEAQRRICELRERQRLLAEEIERLEEQIDKT